MKNLKKNKKNQYFGDNQVEAVRNFGGSIANTFASDLLKEGAGDLWKQFLGKEKSEKKQKGDLEEGQELNLKEVKSQDKKPTKEDSNRYIEPGINYRREVVHAESRIGSENQKQIQGQIHEIFSELQKLIASSEQLQVQFKEVMVEKMPEKPGKYHVNFFEWLFLTVKQAREKVEDSSAWLSVMKSKKATKQYWNQFKEKGTSFGLSGERSIATQAG